jgi:hypothetical protein
MSTIPTTLDSGTARYTVVGAPRGKACPDSFPVSVLLLHRGSRLYRAEAFRELERIGFESIVSVEERGAEGSDMEALSARHPRARFLLLSEPASPGAMVNLGMRESCGPYVFVLWSDQCLSTQALSSRFFERLAEQDLLCQAPFLSDKGGALLPTAEAPALNKSSLKVLSLAPGRDGARSLYPYDYCGIYSRERFVLTGGFDAGISKPYWQKLDFGFRAWLWGEEIKLASALKVAYGEAPPVEDSTPDEGYRRFWLKNLAPSFHGDSAQLSLSRFWSYLRGPGGSLISGPAEFRAAREWVRINRFRFKTDAPSLVDLWDEGSA